MLPTVEERRTKAGALLQNSGRVLCAAESDREGLAHGGPVEVFARRQPRALRVPARHQPGQRVNADPIQLRSR